MGYNLLINGVFLGVITNLLTFDPNFQRNIQVAIGVGCFAASAPLPQSDKIRFFFYIETARLESLEL